MRMRHKKHLEQRIADVGNVLCVREGYDFYTLSEQERYNVVNLAELFGNDNPVVMEIGCGKGDYAIKCAVNSPSVNFIAVEKLSNVIVDACEKSLPYKLNNLRFINCGAENLLYFVPKHCASSIVLNFSCPFPKKTYANRRLTYTAYLQLYKQLLTDDGIIVQKTDDVDFFNYSLDSYRENGYEVTFVTYDMHKDNVSSVMTEYETKFVSQGKKICYCTAKPVK